MPYVDAGRLAEQYGCSVDTVRRLARQNEIPSIRLGRRLIRFDAEAVARALQANGHSATGSAEASHAV